MNLSMFPIQLYRNTAFSESKLTFSKYYFIKCTQYVMCCTFCLICACFVLKVGDNILKTISQLLDIENDVLLASNRKHNTSSKWVNIRVCSWLYSMPHHKMADNYLIFYFIILVYNHTSLWAVKILFLFPHVNISSWLFHWFQ